MFLIKKRLCVTLLPAILIAVTLMVNSFPLIQIFSTEMPKSTLEKDCNRPIVMDTNSPPQPISTLTPELTPITAIIQNPDIQEPEPTPPVEPTPPETQPPEPQPPRQPPSTPEEPPLTFNFGACFNDCVTDLLPYYDNFSIIEPMCNNRCR